MKYDKARHQALLNQSCLLHQVSLQIFGLSVLPLMSSGLMRAPARLAAKTAYAEKAKSTLEAAGLSWGRWGKHVERYADEVADGTVTATPEALKKVGGEKALEKLIAAARERISKELGALAPSLEKAMTALEFEVNVTTSESSDSPFPDVLTSIPNLNPQVESECKRRIRLQLISGNLPTAARAWEDEVAVAWLKYAERYALSTSRGLVDSASRELVESLRETTSQLWENAGDTTPFNDLTSTLHKCWVYGFSNRLRAHAMHDVRSILKIAIGWQGANGAWKRYLNGAARDSGETTAFAVNCLQTYGDDLGAREVVKAGLQWLLKNSNASGGWGTRGLPGSTEDLNIVGTTAALDALRLGGVPEDHPTVKSAEAALIHAQHASGLWIDYRGQGAAYLTTMVLAYFRRRQQRPTTMHEAARRGRGLLLHAHVLTLHGSQTDLILALTALFHGVEYSLYAFLLANPHGTPIRDPHGQTIGFNEALSAFERLAKERGWIDAVSRLPYRQQLTEMKARRDEVIHRMGTISQDEIDQLLEQAWRFIEKFDQQALGFALLD